MKKEIYGPADRTVIVISRANDARVSTIRAKIQTKNGEKVSRSGVIDHLLTTMDINATAAEIAARVKP